MHRLGRIRSFSADPHRCTFRWGKRDKVEDVFAVDFLAIVCPYENPFRLMPRAPETACAALAGGAPAKAFIVRKEVKAHGLQRRIEGPPLSAEDRCVVVEDVVTTGGSTLAAIAALREAGHEICGVISVLDRLTGGAMQIERAAGAPYLALTTIDDIYPDRPDRPVG